MIQMLLRFFIFFAFLVFGLLFTAVQNLFSEDTGFKLFKNYDYIKDYGHNPQNWAIIQDSRGILYVGNLGGVLEFDGVYWRRIFLPNWWARSLSIDETGTIYIGGKNEIGFLQPRSKRKIQYVSLLNHLNENERNFSNVLFTHSTEKGVYFTTYKFLFRWDPGHKHMKVWKSEDRLLSSFACQGKFIKKILLCHHG